MSHPLDSVDHRPWPVPDRSWIMHMSWEQLAFLHWRVDADVIRAQLPEGLELDCFDGTAWCGVVPFLMNNVHARGVPQIPPTNRFLELNLRTYVVHDTKPGVWFFSLDAASRLAVLGGRGCFHLPYFNATMHAELSQPIAYRSRRVHRGATAGSFEATYQPAGDVFRAEPGSLEHWLTERYCLYSASGSRLWRGDVHHVPWPLQPARVTISENSLGALAGLELPGQPEHALFAQGIDVVAWSPTRLR